MGWPAGFSVGELVGDEETAFTADVHSLEAGVPTGNDAVRSGGEGDGLGSGMVVGGVELGAIRKPAGVADGVPLLCLGDGAFANDDVDVLQRVEGLGKSGHSRDFGDRGCCRVVMVNDGSFMVCSLGGGGYSDGGQQGERGEH